MALVPKKSVAIQARQQPSAGVAPVLGGSDASVTVSSVGRATPIVAPVPSAGRVGTDVQGAPSEVTEQPVMAAILLPMVGQTGPSTALMAPIVASVT